jgi:hypothetical protein
MSDLLATLAGVSLHTSVPPLYRSAFVPAGGASLFLAALGALAAIAYTRKVPALLFSIPILLSFDNFIAGLLEGSSHSAQFVVLAGLASGLAAWVGLAIGQLAARRLSQTRAVVISLSLIALAFNLLN